MEEGQSHGGGHRLHRLFRSKEQAAALAGLADREVGKDRYGRNSTLEKVNRYLAIVEADDVLPVHLMLTGY